MNLLLTELCPILAKMQGSFWFPKNNSSFTSNVDGTFYFILALDTFFVLIIGLMVYFMFKYKRVEGVEPQPSPSHNTILEITWTAIPSFLVVVIFALGFAGYADMRTPPPDAEVIYVNGKQWSWLMTYPNGYSDQNLHVTVGKPYKLVMTSQDVLHSFFIPVTRAKQDVVPGRYTFLWFDTKETGVSDIFCTEYCGKQHSIMKSVFYVHPVEANPNPKANVEELNYDQWMTIALDPTINDSYKTDGKYDPAKYGAKLYEARGCKGCHNLDDKKNTGPSFQNNWGYSRDFTDGTKEVMDENYVMNSIFYPGKQIRVGFDNKMPSFAGQLKPVDIQAIVAFLKTQSDKK